MKKGLIIVILSACYLVSLLSSPVIAQGKPDLTIISPQKGVTIFGDKVVFSFFTSNFLMGIDGYLIVSLDQREPIILKEQKDYAFTKLGGGKHELGAEIVDKKEKPLLMPVKKEVSFLSVLPKDKTEALAKRSSSETQAIKTLKFLSFALLSLALASLVVVIVKFYINTKAGKDSTHQKPLGGGKPDIKTKTADGR